MQRKVASRLDDLAATVIDKLLPHFYGKQLSGSSKGNPKLYSQVLPRLERAQKLIEKHGEHAAVPVAGCEADGEYRVLSERGDDRYV